MIIAEVIICNEQNCFPFVSLQCRSDIVTFVNIKLSNNMWLATGVGDITSIIKKLPVAIFDTSRTSCVYRGNQW